MFRHSLAIAKRDAWILRRDPFPIVVILVMPLLTMPFIQPAYRDALRAQGNVTANGAEQAVPGMAVMFGFFLAGMIALSFFRERAWNTWDRLRSSSASLASIIGGKLVPLLIVAASNLVILFALGAALFDLEVRGAWTDVVLVSCALAAVQAALGLTIFAVCRTLQQSATLSNLSALAFAGVGGALTPIDNLPAVARAIAPASPGYWAMRGYRAAIFGHASGEAVQSAVMLVAIASILLCVSTFKIRRSQERAAWA